MTMRTIPALLLLGTLLLSATALAGEWPATCPVPAGARVLLLGDSIVAPGMYAHVINTLTDRAYPEAKTIFSSFGMAGATTKSIVPELPKALAGKSYDWLLLNFGHNDSGQFTPEQFAVYGRALLSAIRKLAPGARLGWMSVVGTEPTPYAGEPGQEKRAAGLLASRAKCAALALATKTLCAEEKILYLPLHETFAEVLKERDAQGLKVCFTMDGVHPNLAGNWLLGAALMQGLGLKPAPGTVDVLQADAFSDQSRLAVDSSAKPVDLRFKDLFLGVRLIPPPTAELVAVRVAKPVVLDGDLADWPAAPACRIAAPLHVTMEFVPRQAERYAASVRACHDGTSLFLAFEVKEPDTGEGTWFPEIIEFFIDARADPATSGNVWRQPPGLTQFCFHRDFSQPQPAAKLMVNGDKTQGDGMRAAVRQAADGYTLEAAIPLAGFETVAVKSGTRIPMDWAVSYTDQALNLDWLGLMSRSGSTRGYGTLRLE